VIQPVSASLVTSIPPRAKALEQANSGADSVQLQGPGESRPYYDARADLKARSEYYQGLNLEASPQDLYRQLSRVLQETHKNKLGYDPEERLYKWVDLRPNLRLNSLYSTQETPSNLGPRVKEPMDYRILSELSRKEFKKLKIEVRQQHLSRLQQQVTRWAEQISQGGTDAVSLAQKLAQVETQAYFNCEHVVPRKWFSEQGPMAGDLHHLFTSQSSSNSVRGSRRFTEVSDKSLPAEEGWAPMGVNAFEPQGGKGAIARATLYFLLRYPGQIGDQEGEYGPEDIQTLLRWHQQEPVSLHELHRNQAIAQEQGNRNPLIDHPEWASKIDFTQGLGRIRKPILKPPPSYPRQHYRGGPRF